MTIYFLRHGHADWPHWEGSDDERPLTTEGKKEMRQVGDLLAKLGLKPGAILSSPLPRALQTAEIAAESLEMKVVVEESLAPGFNAAKLRELLKKHDEKKVMVVGHEPDFSSAILALTGGVVKMSKAGLARVDLEDGANGFLVWLFSPKFAKL
ncbi:MAG: phosphohistidine phosphatase SixA [Verrucomicrobiota bacterium]|nr:phosphohistidine phosphatase SixA [Verrucomicrobiota bacterium]